MHPVVHFEIPYNDATRVADFYGTAFGWQTQALGQNMGNYIVADTCETASGRPVQPGAINGGFFERTPDGPAQHPSVVIAVEDIQASMLKVEQAGGTVLGEPMSIPGIGAYVSFLDTEGNRVAMLQPLRQPDS
ncbi:MAG: VOC family protein [Giesbergeria sp.]|nr:VOC family protein [Giesbergeria sp.]